MKLLFNKTEYYGHWFEDEETPEGFTEKIPPHTGVVFDEEQNDWVLKPSTESEQEPELNIEQEPGQEIEEKEELEPEQELKTETEPAPEIEEEPVAQELNIEQEPEPEITD
jgi:hypothetical protein